MKELFIQGFLARLSIEQLMHVLQDLQVCTKLEQVQAVLQHYFGTKNIFLGVDADAQCMQLTREAYDRVHYRQTTFPSEYRQHYEAIVVYVLMKYHDELRTWPMDAVKKDRPLIAELGIILDTLEPLQQLAFDHVLDRLLDTGEAFDTMQKGGFTEYDWSAKSA